MQARNEKKTGATNVPLTLWAVTIGFLLIAYFTVDALGKQWNFIDVCKPEFTTVNQKRIQDFALSQEDLKAKQLRIVVLGTSLTRYGSYWEYDPMIPPRFQDIKLLNISQPAGLLDDFYSILEDVVSIHPDLIIIQSDLLRVDSAETGANRLRKIGRIMTKRLMNTFFEKKTRYGATVTELEWKHQKDRGSLSRAGFYDLQMAKRVGQWYSQDAILSKRFLNFASSVKNSGGEVVVLHMFRYNGLRKNYHQQLQTWLAHLEDELRAQANIQLWKSPSYFDRTDYIDSAHFSSHGRERFYCWLLSRFHQFSLLRAEP